MRRGDPCSSVLSSKIAQVSFFSIFFLLTEPWNYQRKSQIPTSEFFSLFFVKKCGKKQKKTFLEIFLPNLTHVRQSTTYPKNFQEGLLSIEHRLLPKKQEPMFCFICPFSSFSDKSLEESLDHFFTLSFLRFINEKPGLVATFPVDVSLSIPRIPSLENLLPAAQWIPLPREAQVFFLFIFLNFQTLIC